MKEVGLYMMYILKYMFVIGIFLGFYIYEFLKKMLIIVLIKIWCISIFEMLKR